MGMFNVHVMSGRMLGCVIVSGIISTCVSYYLITASSKRRVEISDDDHQLSHRMGNTDPYDFDSVEAMDDSLNDFPPDFRVIIHGGAGVVSKGIDSKPFFDALTRIMGEAYKFAKDGDNTVTGDRIVTLYSSGHPAPLVPGIFPYQLLFLTRSIRPRGALRETSRR